MTKVVGVDLKVPGGSRMTNGNIFHGIVILSDDITVD